MIPKADILEAARVQSLLTTTVEKDYVLGWLLYGISGDDVLSRWVFKGGTCLKKCFFETYRFSEDLDFTIPTDQPLDEGIIRSGIVRITKWVEAECGLAFPSDGLEVEKYLNKRGQPSFRARVTYAGPLQMPRRNLQRVKFDITQDEVLAGETDLRSVHHAYRDAREPALRVRAYSVNEVLAEKSRALYERQGRARDVYDVVHLNRSFRDQIDARETARLVATKFTFKDLPEPTVDVILARIDFDQLRTSWAEQLAHQLAFLAPVDDFIAELRDALAWWLAPSTAAPQPPAMTMSPGEVVVPRDLFPTFRRGVVFGSQPFDVIRLAARNRVLARIRYHGHERIVEAYSLRRKRTGNVLLYAHERTKDGLITNSTRAYKVDEIESASTTSVAFVPRYYIEI